MIIIKIILSILRGVSTMILVIEFALVSILVMLGTMFSSYLLYETSFSIGGLTFVSNFLGVFLLWYCLLSALLMQFYVLCRFPLCGESINTRWWIGVFIGVTLASLAFLTSLFGLVNDSEVVELFAMGWVLLIPFVHTMIEFGLQTRDWLNGKRLRALSMSSSEAN